MSWLTKKILGIWLPDYEVSLEELRDLGYNGLVIRTDWQEGDTFDTYLERMWVLYRKAKALGFEFFLIDIGQGLGKYDNNYNYLRVIQKFSKENNVLFYIGEPYESYVESGILSEEKMIDIVNEKIKLTYPNIFMDATIRNLMRTYYNFKPRYIAISSYYKQHKYWVYTNACWIYGQLKFGGSLRYKYLGKQANEHQINIRLLYQGDSDNFELSKPYTWLNYILKLFGLRKKFEAFMRKRFAKYFK